MGENPRKKPAGRLGNDRKTVPESSENGEKHKNLLKNKIALDDVTLICGNVLSEEDKLAAMGIGYDVICANIVAQIIKDMAPLLLNALKPGGILLASGILESREAEVTEALLNAGFKLLKSHLSEEWVCLELTK